MTNTVARKTIIGLFFILLTSSANHAFGAKHPIIQFYKEHRFDADMEAKHVPPKLAAMFLDDNDYKDARDVLQALRSLRYLNYYGEKSKISEYAKEAISAKGDYESIFEEQKGNRTVKVFGKKKDRKVREVFAVVETKTQFLLLIGKGKLNNSHVRKIPKLTKEIQ